MTPDSNTPFRFDIALSFSGEYRDFVKQVAVNLANIFTHKRVLYDHFHDAELARPNSNVYLPNLYRKDSELIVIFLCSDYANKSWCKLEWRHINQLIATEDAKRIMFFSFGNPGDLTELGVLAGDIYIDIEANNLTEHEVSEKIIDRINFNRLYRKPFLDAAVARERSEFPIMSNKKRIDCFLLMTDEDDFLGELKSELKGHFNGQLVDRDPGKNDPKKYREYLDEFICSPQTWLLTTIPFDQQEYFINTIFPQIHDKKEKKFLFFESGSDLHSEWRRKYQEFPTPFVTIETDFEAAAERLLEIAVKRHLSKCTKKIAVITLLPDDTNANKRAAVYYRFLGEALCRKTKVESTTSKGFSDLLNYLGVKNIEIYQWHITGEEGCWTTGPKKVIMENIDCIEAAMKAESVMFLCGNDTIAKQVSLNLDDKTKPILVGFDGSPAYKDLKQEGFAVITAIVDFDHMCRKAKDFINRKVTIDSSNNEQRIAATIK